jgi:hypothetical protein
MAEANMRTLQGRRSAPMQMVDSYQEQTSQYGYGEKEIAAGTFRSGGCEGLSCRSRDASFPLRPDRKQACRHRLGQGLARTFDQSTRRFGVRTSELDEWRFFFITNHSRLSWNEPRVHDSYQGLVVTRPGGHLSGTAPDTLDHLNQKQLREAAQAILHFVMVLSYC